MKRILLVVYLICAGCFVHLLITGCENIDSRTTGVGSGDGSLSPLQKSVPTGSAAGDETSGGGTGGTGGGTGGGSGGTGGGGQTKQLLRASVNTELCIGCGLCAAVCPSVFRLTDGKSHVIVSSIPDQSVDCTKQSAGICPVSAITVFLR